MRRRAGYALAAVPLLCALAGAAGAAVQDAFVPPPPGALACSGCHRPAGGGGIPVVHGRDAGEIADAVRAFRSGERPATVMDRIARGFSDGETQAIAAWLAAQRD